MQFYDNKFVRKLEDAESRNERQRERIGKIIMYKSQIWLFNVADSIAYRQISIALISPLFL
jgi:hypothetical protein